MTIAEGLDAVVNKFWKLDNVPRSSSLSEEDERCERLFSQNTHRDDIGRFVVAYPFISEPPLFIDSRAIAIRRFHALEHRFR